MTPKSLSFIIKELNHQYLDSFGKMGFKILMEGIVEDDDKTSHSLQGKLYEVCQKETEMRELHISLREATNYLIQLFYRTEQKYSCTRTKLGKLLSIVAFVFARQGRILFDEKIYKYDICGTAIRGLADDFPQREIYNSFSYQDKKNIINREEIKEETYIQNFYKDYIKYTDTKSLSQEVIDIIEMVFMRFGAYDAVDLGECMNLIVLHPGVTLADGEIDLLKINNLGKAEFSLEDTHNLDVIDFLFD